ncbi:unnamed protein product [Rotaria socialis]|uniref:Uncharacterized protein n=1 Tax=Rotaria socialis TaxID=392032 RepID=A0A818F266_9BILA|nr:unnamed protein product [Rotaria socialis]CAF4436234.1 unnamed protein product [Rotaria socialis]
MTEADTIQSGFLKRLFTSKVVNITINTLCQTGNDVVLIRYDESIDDDLKDSLGKIISRVTCQLTTFSWFCQPIKAIRDLEKDSLNFLWYQLLRDTLLTIDKSDGQVKQELVHKCRQYYALNKAQLSNIDKFEKEYESTKVIQWYTKNSFLFHLIKRPLRTEDIDALLSLGFYITDLCLHLKNVCDQEREYHEDILQVYRGQTLSTEEIEKYRSAAMATIFADNVICQVDIHTQLSSVIFADIYRFSEFPEEKKSYSI